MQKKEHEYYENIGDWNFDEIKYKVERLKKWELYEKAVDEKLVRTSTANAPWIIVEGNDKLYARIKVLETVVEALEKRMKEEK